MSAQPIKVPAPPVMHASRDIESVRTPSADERLATWAAKYFLRGHHRAPQKPRMRVTVPQPRAASAPLAESASPGAIPDARSLASTCKDLVPVVRELRDDETGEVYEVAERHVEYLGPPF